MADQLFIPEEDPMVMSDAISRAYRVWAERWDDQGLPYNPPTDGRATDYPEHSMVVEMEGDSAEDFDAEVLRQLDLIRSERASAAAEASQ